MTHFPAYPKKPHASGQARIRIDGRDVYLGTWNSPESRAEYARLATLYARGPTAPAGTDAAKLTVADVVARFLDHTEAEGGKEYANFKSPCKLLLETCGDMLASDFDTLALRQVRAKMVLVWTLNVIHRQTTRIKTIWRWAEAEKLVPRGSWDHLRSLPPLDRRSKGVRCTKPRDPVAWELVQLTLPHLAPVGVGMVLFQWWSGARPGEVVAAKVSDLDTTSIEGCWLLTLDRHKTDWKTDAPRVLVLGPECQRVLAPFLGMARLLGDDAPLFATTKQEHFTVAAYKQMVYKAIKRHSLPHWSLYQIRHAAKRRIERLAGEQGARAFLGQQSVESTRGYAARQDVELAAEIARRAG